MNKLLLLILLFPCYPYAQTFITPQIGGRYLYFINETKPSPTIFSSLDIDIYNNFKNLNYQAGFKIEQLISDRTLVQYDFGISKYSIDVYAPRQFVPMVFSFSFLFFSNSLGLTYYASEAISFGIGINYNIFSTDDQFFISDTNGYTKNRKEVGGYASVNFDFDNVILSFKISNYFYYPNKAQVAHDFKGTRSFELNLGYRFKAIKKFRGKERVLCPN